MASHFALKLYSRDMFSNLKLKFVHGVLVCDKYRIPSSQNWIALDGFAIFSLIYSIRLVSCSHKVLFSHGVVQLYRCYSKLIYSLDTQKKVIGKHCRPRSDAVSDQGLRCLQTF